MTGEESAVAGFEGLEFLASMESSSRQAVLDIGEEVTHDRGAIVITRGEPLEAMFLVIEGVLEVLDGNDRLLARLGPGSIVGEVAFATGHSATARVVATERAMGLSVDFELLRAAMAASELLQSHVWQAIAKTCARRLGGTIAFTPHDTDLGLPPELDAAVKGVEAFLVAAEQGIDVPDDLVDQGLTTFSHALIEVFDTDAAGPVFARLRQRLLPSVVHSPYLRRVWEKPMGYAGDWETIELIYRNEATGESLAGIALDGAFLRTHASQAVRNRRPLLSAQIRAAAAEGPARITSLACGPAREIIDVFDADPDVFDEINLLDIDQTAIDNANNAFGERNALELVNLHRSNLIRLALGRGEVALANQDLVYSIGLIDYFPDDLVVALLDLIHPWLAPGGRVILGNFHPSNPSRGIMELFEWSLIHRSEADMNHRLFEASAFAEPCAEILWEDEHINLFAVGVKR